MRFWPMLLVLLFSCEARPGESGSAPTVPTSKDYRIELSAPATMKVGAPAACEITVTPTAPWLLKAETPFSAELTPDAGLEVEKAKLSGKDFVDPAAPAKSVRTPCVAQTAGTHQLSAKLSFFLCSHEICKRMNDRVTATLKAD